MANQEHLDILKQGIKVWNKWRQENPQIRPDLQRANLRGWVLSVAPISLEMYNRIERTNSRELDRIEEYFYEEYNISVTYDEEHLRGLDLSGVDLRGADLSGTFLIGANLRNSDLRGATLGGERPEYGPLPGIFTPSILFRATPSAKILRADFGGADLRDAYLRGVDLRGRLTSLSFLDMHPGPILRRAGPRGPSLVRELGDVHIFAPDVPRGPNLSGANLSGLDLSRLNLDGAYFAGANLGDAELSGSSLIEANLRGAILRGADIRRATLIGTNLSGADLTDCTVFGISAWRLNLSGAKQKDLIITDYPESTITVDDLQVAQFTHLLLNNEKIRDVIDTITSKGVLILGRFTPERKAILDALREKLRDLDYLPMMFDFKRPKDRDFTETIMTLAGLCRFVIADITNPSSSPLELQASVPNYMIPFVPIIQKGEKPFSMFKDLYRKYDWVLAPLEYPDKDRLVEKLEEAVIDPALVKYRELAMRKAAEIPVRSI